MPFRSIVEPHLPDSELGIVVAFAICIAFFETISQNSLKYYSGNYESCSHMMMGIGLAGYVMVALLLLTSYNFVAMGKMNLIWSCISIITACVLGYIIFQENFDNYTISSIVLALSAIYVAHLGELAANDII
jgi:multidrug transporter EmrE-like cation transporter